MGINWNRENAVAGAQTTSRCDGYHQPSVVNINNINIKIDSESIAKALQNQAQAQAQI
ncbi:MAG: hypothetical protein LPK00_07585 [Bacillaceae bacterium]|nr:hypothetical protein [Bacillaceae bacterium]